MGLIGKLFTGATLVAGGVVIGTSIGNNSDYAIKHNGKETILKDKNNKTEYVLTKTEKGTYLGDAFHNFEGAFILGAQEIAKRKVSADSLEEKFMKSYQGGK